ncbi:MAG: TIGR04053 family radical SAM/SPASM domain-containing protein [Candidatus Methylomirabilales bacterium]
MIDVSALYCGLENPALPHRYGRMVHRLKPDEEAHRLAPLAAERRPVVVWNVTRTCNLRCLHCYSDSEPKRYPGELSTVEAEAFIEDLGRYRIPALLLSGGEPLTRPDLFVLASRARERGLRVVLSTNGTLITEAVAKRIREVGFSYVGISLDGLEAANDRFRGMKGAFRQTLHGFRKLVEVGQKVGLRMTLTRQNVEDLPRIFDLIEREGIRRACFYHLVPAGRGQDVVGLEPEEIRRAMDLILERARILSRRDPPVEILTVDNHCDGPYLYLRLLQEGDPRAAEVYEMLRWNGGGLYSSGVGIACVDFVGNVHPDQFWMHYTLGNIRQRPFSEIWQDSTEPLLAKLRDRKRYLTGRCAACRFLDLCGGSFRVRAAIATGDPWAPDPACYLTDKEIGLGSVAGEQTPYPGDVYRDAPRNVYWEMTIACDLACKHCRADAIPHRDPSELTTEEGKGLMRDVKEMGSKMILTGGDPMKRHDLFELMAYAREIRLPVGITPSTTPTLTRDAVRRFRELGVATLGVSLDGPSPDVHDTFRGVPGTFEHSMNALQWAREFQLPVQVNTTVTRETLPHLSALYRLLREEASPPVRRWSLFLLVPVGRGATLGIPSAEEVEELFAWVYLISKDAPFHVSTVEAPHYRRYWIQRRREEGMPLEEIQRLGKRMGFGIRDGNGVIFVSHQGEVYPAGFLPHPLLGNVRGKPLSEIYRNSSFLMELRDMDRLTGKCGRCEFRWICGGSRARAYAATGDCLAEEPLCVYQPGGRQIGGGPAVTPKASPGEALAG